MRPKQIFPETVLIKNGKTQRIEKAKVLKYYVRKGVQYFDVITERQSVFNGLTANTLKEFTYIYKTL